MDPATTIFFLCDVQTRFKPAIHAYPHVVATANKMLRLATLLSIPVLATTQNQKSLGPIDPDIDIASLGPLLLGPIDKSLFSMYTPAVQALIPSHVVSIVIFGIESHVCVLQTVLSLLAERRFAVHIVADGVSSCNAFEIPIALDRMRSEGAIVGTSESIAFQLIRDAASPHFKAFSKFIKDLKEPTKAAGEVLLQHTIPSSTPGTPDIASGGVIMKL